jgi:glycosyltransferase involved in cell wall biosynthesis
LKTIVTQIGAREHYAVARALHQQGMLAGLVTDWYAPSWLKRKTSANGRLSSASAARCEELPDKLVRSFPLRSLWWKWQIRRAARHGATQKVHEQTDAAFAKAAARLHLPKHDAFFGYSYASLEFLEAEKKRGMLTVLDQIDPGEKEFRIVAEEMRRHPEIAGVAPEFPTAYYERNQREWELADIIVVNSEWSREALISEGAAPAKIEILPLAYEAANANRQAGDNKLKPDSSAAPLRVLWLGQVNVRKGIHHLMEAARLLQNENVRFDVVGPVGILPGATAAAPANMTFHGPVSRDRAAEWYRQSDVFVLPTISDGFALTQLEALAHALPVIATPNCGRVVEEGRTGFTVPPRDPQALADAVMRFVRDRSLARSMRNTCLEAVKKFSVEALGVELVKIMRKHSALPKP